MIEVDLRDAAGGDVGAHDRLGVLHGEADVVQAALVGPPGGVADDDREDVAGEVVVVRPAQGAEEGERPLPQPSSSTTGRLAAEERRPVERPVFGGQAFDRRAGPIRLGQDRPGIGTPNSVSIAGSGASSAGRGSRGRRSIGVGSSGGARGSSCSGRCPGRRRARSHPDLVDAVGDQGLAEDQADADSVRPPGSTRATDSDLLVRRRRVVGSLEDVVIAADRDSGPGRRGDRSGRPAARKRRAKPSGRALSLADAEGGPSRITDAVDRPLLGLAAPGRLAEAADVEGAVGGERQADRAEEAVEERVAGPLRDAVDRLRGWRGG